MPEVRAQAREYLVEVDPDFVVIAPPCGPWSQVQLLNQRTPLQVRELQKKREEARELLLLWKKRCIFSCGVDEHLW